MSATDGKYIYFQVCLKNWANPTATTASFNVNNAVHFPVKLLFKFGAGNLRPELLKPVVNGTIDSSVEDIDAQPNLNSMSVDEKSMEDLVPARFSNEQSIDLSQEDVMQATLDKNKSQQQLDVKSDRSDGFGK